GAVAVRGPRLARVEHADGDPELGEADVALERAERAQLLGVAPAGVVDVEDEPALALRDEAALALDELRFRHRHSRSVIPYRWQGGRSPRRRGAVAHP